MQACTCEGALGSSREYLCVSEHMLSGWAEAAHSACWDEGTSRFLLFPQHFQTPSSAPG